MSKRGKLAALAAVVMAMSTFVQPAGADVTEDEQWPVPQGRTPGYHGIVVQNAVDFLQGIPLLLATDRGNGPDAWNRYVCASTSSPNCGPTDGVDVYAFNAILPVCTTAEQLDCVETLESIDASGAPSPAAFTEYVFPNHPNIYPADARLGIPGGFSPSVWRLPTAAHGFGNDYVLNVSLSGDFDASQRVSAMDLAASLVPVSRQPGAATEEGLPKCWSWLDPLTKRYNNSCSTDPTPVGANYRCAFAAEPLVNGRPDCLLSHAFPADSRFRVTLRLRQEPIAWLHGRMTAPNISVSARAAGGVQVSVEAAPTKVPVVHYADLWANLPATLQDFWQQCEKQTYRCSGAGIHSLPLEQRTGTMSLPSYGAAALEAVKRMAPLQQDRATVAPSAWSFYTLPSNQLQGANSCIRTGVGVKGIVTTNSTAYSEGPPAFVDGYLNYKVAAPHYDPKGELFRGDYSLVIRSDVARCLYQFSSAPISATVDVISESGDNQVATTVTSERDGWLYMRASGFTFSAPTVRAKLTQVKPARSATKPAKKTITCVKGKTVRRVTADAPKCPAGFKKR